MRMTFLTLAVAAVTISAATTWAEDEETDSPRSPSEIRAELKHAAGDNLVEAFKNSTVAKCVPDELIGQENPATTGEQADLIEACVRGQLKSALRNVRAIRAGFGVASSRALRNAANDLISQYSSDEDPAPEA